MRGRRAERDGMQGDFECAVLNGVRLFSFLEIEGVVKFKASNHAAEVALDMPRCAELEAELVCPTRNRGEQARFTAAYVDRTSGEVCG